MPRLCRKIVSFSECVTTVTKLAQKWSASVLAIEATV